MSKINRPLNDSFNKDSDDVKKLKESDKNRVVRKVNPVNTFDEPLQSQSPNDDLFEQESTSKLSSKKKSKGNPRLSQRVGRRATSAVKNGSELAQKIGKMMFQFLKQIVNTVVRGILFVGGLLGGGLVAGIALILVMLMLITFIVGVVGAIFASDSSSYEGGLVDCSVNVREILDDGEVDEERLKLDVAQKIYYVLSAYELSDMNVAGVLGNFDVESGLDPTAIEGIFSDKFNIGGDSKYLAVTDLNDYTLNVLFPMYTNSGLSINQNFYQASDELFYPGIGLAQWTGENARKLIEVANLMGHNWWSVEFQIAYIVATSSPTGRPYFWRDYRQSLFTDVGEAVTYFALNYEGINNQSLSLRTERASQWYTLVSSWEMDTVYAQGVFALASQMREEELDATAKEAMDSCVKVLNYDNSTIARAAVTFAHPRTEDGRENNGTLLYQAVSDGIFGDRIYQSCDRAVALAIRWSGTDISFPPGGSTIQGRYMSTSDKWTEITTTHGGFIDITLLQPGDIFSNNNHTFVYVGNQLVVEIFGGLNPNGNMVFASVAGPSSSPAVSNYNVAINVQNDYTQLGYVYTVYRNVSSDLSSKYKSVGAYYNEGGITSEQ